MSISISEPMRITLDALYEGRPAPPEALAALTEKERAEVASLVRTANVVSLSLNQPEPTAEMEAAALSRAHQAMAKIPSAPANTGGNTENKPESKSDTGNWFTRLFKKPSP